MSFPTYAHYKDSGVEWLGEVPAHWETKRIKHLIRAFEQGWSPQCEGYPVESSEEWGVLKVGCVNGGTFRREENKALPAEIEPIPALGISAGDLLISRANTRELVGSAAVAEEDYSNLLLCDKLYRVRLKPQVCDPRFLGLYLGTEAARGQIELAATGASSSMVNIGQSTILEMQLSLPAHEEQLQIAAFLRSETTKLDALITEQRTLIDLLKEKRQAVISHAVTKGLDPRVPMKDSGVEWLGEVPAHWQILPLGFIAVDKCDGPFGSGIKSEHYTDEGALVVRLQNIRAGAFNMGEPVYLAKEYFLSQLKGHEVLAGDVLVAGLGDDNNLLGRACVAPEGLGMALVKADCFRFRIDPERCIPEYVALQLSAGAAFDAGTLATGTTRSRIPLGTMAARKFAFPELMEQKEIVTFINQEINRLDVLTAEAQTTIALLQERRSALISAAVTGKIDVRQHTTEAA